MIIVIRLTPAAVHILAVRQLPGLGPVLKGIMSQTQSQESPAAPAAPAAPDAPITTLLPNQDCADAIAKIDEALTVSKRYTSASRNQPTIREIQAVLAIFAASLGDDCHERNNSLENITATRKPAAIGRRATKCSDCERQLYGIVKGLQQILSMARTGKGGLSSVVESAMTVPSTTVSMPTMVLISSSQLSNMTSILAMSSVTTPTMVGLPVTRV